MSYYLCIGLRELFRTGRGERSPKGNENRHGKVQRKYAYERAHIQHGVVKTGYGIKQHTRI